MDTPNSLLSALDTERLGLSGAKALFQIAEKGRLADAEAHAFLGESLEHIAARSYSEKPDLGKKELQRVGISKALTVLYSPEFVGAWVLCSNTSCLVNGTRSLDMVIRDKLPALQAFCKFLNGRQTGAV